jgi:hypothetical protein
MNDSGYSYKFWAYLGWGILAFFALCFELEHWRDCAKPDYYDTHPSCWEDDDK